MKKFWGRSKKKVDDEGLLELEYYLLKVLKPVEPRAGFVSDLGARLADTQVTRIQFPFKVQYIFLAAAGLISSVIIVITGIRATVTLLGAMGLMRHIKTQAQSN